MEHESRRSRLIILGLAIVVAVLTSSCSVFPPDASAEASASCNDVSLLRSSAETTVTFHGSGTELPEISTETAVSVPMNWPDIDKLLMPSFTKEKVAALKCLLGSSDERHSSAPDVRIDEPKSSQARLVVLHEQVSVSNDYDSPSWTLGQWQLQYESSPEPQGLSMTHADGTQDLRSLSIEPGDILATFSLPPLTAHHPKAAGKPVMDEINVHLDLSDAALVQAERSPDVFSGGNQMSWKITRPTSGYKFWVLLRPDKASALPLTLLHGS